MKNLKSKKLVSLFLTMLMLLSCMSIFVVNAEIDTSVSNHGKNIIITAKNDMIEKESIDTKIENGRVGFTSNNGYIVFKINAPMDGKYKVTFLNVYTYSDEWVRFYKYNGTDFSTQIAAGHFHVDNANTSQWITDSGTKDIVVPLTKGENKLKVKIASASGRFIDRIAFEYEEEQSVDAMFSDADYINGSKTVKKSEETEITVSGNAFEAWSALGYPTPYNEFQMTKGRAIGFDVDFLVSGKYVVTLTSGGNPNYVPKFVLTNNNTGDSISRLTEQENDITVLRQYEMGTIDINRGDVLTLENVTGGGDTRFQKLTFKRVGDIEVIKIKATGSIIEKESVDTKIENGRVGFTSHNGYIVFNVYAPTTANYKVTFENIYTYSDEWVRFYKYNGTDFSTQIAAGHFHVDNANTSQWITDSGTKDIVVPLTKGENKLKVKIASASGRFIDRIIFNYTEPKPITVSYKDFEYVDRVQQSYPHTEYYGLAWMAKGRSLSMCFTQALTGGTYRVKIQGYSCNDNVSTEEYKKEPKLDFINEMNGSRYQIKFPSYENVGRTLQTVEVGVFELNYGDVLTVECNDIYSAFSGLVFEKVESIKVNGDVDGSLKGGDNTVVVPANFDSKLTSNAVIFGAVYNDGVLYSVDMKDYSQTGGATLNLKAPSDLTKVTYKIFFWEKETLKPILSTYPAVDTTTNTVYVSKKGFDMNNGNEATPVASLQRAKELANEKKSSIDSDIEVIIGEGEYNLENELFFLGADSGNGDHKIIYRGAENGKTVINGGVKLENWISDGNLKVATNDKIKNKVRHLSVNDGYTAMSRSPKITNGITVSGNNLVIENSKLGSFDKEKLKNEKNAEVYGVMGFSDVRIPVKEFIVGDSSTTIVFDPTSTAIHDYTKTVEGEKKEIPTAQRFVDWIGTHNSQSFGGIYIENALAFTDSEGEYYCDTENHKIYYYTADSVGNMAIYAPISEGLLNFDGVKNVTIENITFKNGTWNRPSVYGMVTRQAEKYDVKKNEFAERGGDLVKGQITLNNCENVVIKNNTLKNMGSTAIALRLNNKNCEVSGNTIKNTAGGAISVGHLIDREKNTQNIVVKNNDIDNAGLQYRSCPAITVYFANGVQILHNDINNVAYTGISLGLSWTEYVANVGNYEVAYNKVANVMTETDDGSHIYTNGPIFGTKIHDNYLVKGNGWQNGQNSPDRGGIYFDNGSCDIEAYNNVIEQCGTWLFAVDTRLGKYCPNNGINCSDCNNRTCKETELKVHDNYTDTNVVVNSATNTITVTNTVSNTSTNAVNIKNVAGVEK